MKLTQHEEMMHAAEKLHKELEELLSCEGRGSFPISKQLEAILFGRVFDNRINEIRYFVHMGHHEDAINGLTFLSTMIEDGR